MAGQIFLILGMFCIAYGLGILCYAGIHAAFVWFWMGAGLCSLTITAVCRVSSLQAAFFRIPAGLRRGGLLLVLCGILLFAAAEGCVISGMSGQPESKLQYVIVLGAQVRGTKVSRALKQRLDQAAAYARENPETILIVSGGQGGGEDITEAQAMETYLLEAGMHADRILQENRSENTEQNIRYSMALMEEEPGKVGIVSNDFHLFRAVHIAKAQGLAAEGIPAPTEWFMRLNYMTREAFAVVKDLLKGNAVF